jgi:hypothetical protein
MITKKEIGMTEVEIEKYIIDRIGKHNYEKYIKRYNCTKLELVRTYRRFLIKYMSQHKTPTKTFIAYRSSLDKLIYTTRSSSKFMYILKRIKGGILCGLRYLSLY